MKVLLGNRLAELDCLGIMHIDLHENNFRFSYNCSYRIINISNTILDENYVKYVEWIFSCISIASHMGVFRGHRISETRAPLKTPAWEASISMNSNERISQDKIN